MKHIISFILLLTLIIPYLAFAQNTDDFKLASQYYQNEEYDKAAVLYEKLFKQTSSHFYYDTYLECLLALNDFPKAEKFIKKQIKKNPQQLSYLVDLGYIYKSKSDEKKADKSFKEALGKLTANPSQVEELAAAFASKKELDLAIATFQQGRKMFRNELVYHYELAELYNENGQKDKMIVEYLTLLEFDRQKLKDIQNSLQASLRKKSDYAKLRTILLRKIQRDPSLHVYSELLIWHFIQLKDFNSALLQTIALDKRYKEDGNRVIVLANLAVRNKNYTIGVKAIQYVIDKGPSGTNYLFAKRKLLDFKLRKIESTISVSNEEILNIEAEYYKFIDEFGENHNTAMVMKDLAFVNVFYLKKYDEAIQILEKILTIPRIDPLFKGECKIDLGDIYLITGNVWESTLYYSQVDKAFKDEPICHEARYKNAKLSFYKGEFDWAQAQLDILKSATTELISNDAINLSVLIMDNLGLDTITTPMELYAKADLLMFQQKVDEAIIVFDELISTYPGHNLLDEIYFSKAMIFKKRGDFEKTIEYLESILKDYKDDILADDATYELALIYEEKLDEEAKAMELYQQILLNFPSSLHVVDARKRFRGLRGDFVK